MNMTPLPQKPLAKHGTCVIQWDDNKTSAPLTLQSDELVAIFFAHQQTQGGQSDMSRPFVPCFFLAAMLLLTVASGAAYSSPSPTIETVRIAVRANSGVEAAIEKWGPTAEMLSQAVPGYTFELVPLVGFDEMRSAVQNGEVDFVLTNPTAYVELETMFGVSRMVTLRNSRTGGGSVDHAAAVFTRSDRADIGTLKDVRGRSIMGVHPEAFGGWWMTLRELKDLGIDPFEDCAEVLFAPDGTHEAVVRAVMSGDADIGTVRTGIIEGLVERGELTAGAVKILNRHDDEIREFHSTRHYPEWPFAALHATPVELSQRVAIVLLSMAPDDPAAVAGGYTGWTIPLDYNRVHDLMRELRVGPYKDHGRVTLGQSLRQHWAAVLSVAVVLIVFCLFTAFVVALNRRLRRTQEVLRRHEEHLEQLVEQRSTELHESEKRYRAIAEDMPILICRFLPGGEITYINKIYCEHFEKTYEELVGSSFLSLIPEKDRETVMSSIAMLTVESPTQTHEHEVISPGGEILWQRWTNRALFDAQGNAVAYQSIGEDITERRRVEKERERLSVAVDQAAETLVITDAEGTIQYVNPAFERTTGYTSEEAIGRNPRILKSGEHDITFYEGMWDTLMRGEAWSGRFINKRKDGTLFTEEAVISPVRDASDRTTNYVAVKRDITAEVKLEEQLHQAQKMESVGRLAGGVAHDFNNMLGVILGHTEIAIEQVDPSLSLHAELTEIRTAAERSVDLTQQLLAFARKQTIAPRLLDLNETVEGMLKMLRRLIGEDLDLAWLPGANVSSVKVDPSQIDQILANLCVNARDAIEDVGKITIETGSAVFDEVYCATHPEFVPGEYVLLAVSDNGSGMDKEILDQLYEPFFTTKERGEGAGLGLATVYGIVKQNGGFINTYSEPGHGTTFKIYLPRYAGKTAQEEQERSVAAAVQGHETILLVEDEPAILALATRMLEGQGYTVLAASTPGEAIRLAEARSSGIHLLLTDVVMPEMNGQDLAKNILSFSPNIKCLFTSGYTANVIAHHGVLDEGIHFIQKPFMNQDLAAKVREALDTE